MNLDRVLVALDSYDGTPSSMQDVVGVFAEELGENWIETIFAELPSISRALKRKLKHVVSYYAATLAWNEAQEYLAQAENINVAEVSDRIPVLQQWLEFFGEEGNKVVAELQELVEQRGQTAFQNQELTAETIDSIRNQPLAQPEVWAPSEGRILEGGKVVTTSEIEASLAEQEKGAEEPEQEPIPDTPEVFTIRKIMTEIDLLKQVQSWLAARCVSLNNMEVYAYPFFGFVVDLLRQTVKDMESLEEKPEYSELLDRIFPEGRKGFDNTKAAIKSDITMAEENCESSVTGLISDNVDMNSVRDALGAIDESDTVEYIGPPPEGFEMLDMSMPLNESAIKAEYAKIENKNVEEELGTSDDDNEKTSQSAKKGVKKKLSFSLKNKKSTGGTT